MKFSLHSLFLVVLTVLFVKTSHAQCSIVASSDGCLDEPISFSTSPANVTAARWDFDDGSTSTQLKPVHRYTSTGQKTVKVTLTLANNSTCTAEHKIFIHAPPELDLEIDTASDFCFTNNNVCINDNSTRGSTNTPIDRRIILWDDGGSSSENNYTSGQKICYRYLQTGKFTLTVELTNNQGCESKKEFNIEIKPDYAPSFSMVSSSVDCEGATFCFENDSTDSQPSDLDNFEWQTGDGKKYSTSWNTLCHTYDDPGEYTMVFKTRLKNGCENEFTQKVKAEIPSIEFNVVDDDSVKCYPQGFDLEQIHQIGYEYSWRILDSNLEVLDSFGTTSRVNLAPPSVGKFYAQLSIDLGECKETLIVDSVWSVGVRADGSFLNSNQCGLYDTVYGCNKSTFFGTDSVTYKWTFGDLDTSVKCTTDHYNGQNVGKNCNVVLGEHAKHFYTEEGCWKAKLVAFDHQNGCADSINRTVILDRPRASDFKYENEKACLGYDGSYSFKFAVDGCPGNVAINFDSACGKDRFTPFNPNHQYTATCDTSRWITVGFTTTTGEVKIYRSCDTSDFYYDSTRICRDTFWKTKWYRLNRTPIAYFSVEQENCVPATVKSTLQFKTQPNVTLVKWLWGDGTDDEYVLDSYDTLPDGNHIYEESGRYTVNVLVETDSGCFETETASLSVGYFNTFKYDTVVCPGQEVEIRDSVKYWNDRMLYWRDITRPEKITWNFGDGNGWSTTGPLPKVTYDNEGTYLIQMATEDKNGCTDTARKYIKVIGVNAVIEDVTKELLCDDIIQFFDSSWTEDITDEIIKWKWDFGDGRTPSFLQDPFHYYSSYGDFVLKLVVETDLGCMDSTEITINIDGPVPDFDIVSDTVGCAPFTAEFRNNSTAVSDFIWYFGDSSNTTLSTQSDSNVKFTYNEPGTYFIYLWGADSVTNPDNNNNIYYCNATFPDSNALNPPVRKIVVLPIPKVDFIMDSLGCSSDEVDLIDNSDSIYEEYRWYISTGDTVISFTGLGSYQFEDTGSYRVDYRPIYEPSGPYQRACFDSISKNILVQPFDGGIEVEQIGNCPQFVFSNIDENARKTTWDFGDNVSKDRFVEGGTVEYDFIDDPGSHEICVFIESQSGCLDTLCTDIESEYEFSLFIPNIITPQRDGLNDEYEIDIQNEDKYDLKIYNRWGELVYESISDHDYGSGLNWNGKDYKTGESCPEGTYFYIFTYSKACYEEEEVVEGTITVVR